MIPLFNKYAIFVLSVSLLLLFSTACSNTVETVESPGMEEPIEVDMCTSSLSANSIYLHYALEKGLFAKQGLDVTLNHAEGGSNATRALMAGNYDICGIAGSAVANASAAGEDLVIVGGAISRLPYALVTLPEVTEPEQLKGQALAISTAGSSSDTAVRIALESIGLDPDKDVTILSIGGQGARMAALEGGSVAGTVVSVPESSRAKELGYNIMLDLAETKIPFQHTAIATRREVVQENREMVERVVRAVTESILLMQGDRQGTIEVLADQMLMDPEDDAAFLNEGYDTLVLKYFDPFPTIAGMELLLNNAKADNPTAVDISAEDIVDLSFMNELEASGFLDGDEK